MQLVLGQTVLYTLKKVERTKHGKAVLPAFVISDESEKDTLKYELLVQSPAGAFAVIATYGDKEGQYTETK